MKKFYSLSLIMVSAFLTSSCSTLTSGIDGAHGLLAGSSIDGPEIEEVLRDGPKDGSRVRWGGRIARVENNRDHSLIEIVEQPLGAHGRPHKANESGGRFIARIEGFVDPVIYAPECLITVTGTLGKTIPGQIGNYYYRFPLVEISEHKLWPERDPSTVVYYTNTAIYDPFAYRPRPWLRRHHRRHP